MAVLYSSSNICDVVSKKTFNTSGSSTMPWNSSLARDSYSTLYFFLTDIYDVNRFDTTFTVPTNLPDGEYVLQAAMLVGNTAKPYNSCSKLRIVGGNPSFNCRSNAAPLKYKCLKSGGPDLPGSVIESGKYSRAY